MATDVRQDLFQTSTGVGHHYRPGYYFPDSNFRSAFLDPIPAELKGPSNIGPIEQFQTTTGTAFAPKHGSAPPYSHLDEKYPKAPGHWKVNYVKDLHEKLQAGGWRRPLSMGNQTSETHEQYRAQPGLSEPKEFTPNYPNFTYKDHLSNGPTKRGVIDAENPKLKGRMFYPSDLGIMDLNEPYLTTNMKCHRVFKPNELDGLAKKDAVTYWQAEDYPKILGHGLKHNPVPMSVFPSNESPMRDAMVFKSATKIRRVPVGMVPVPHSGLKSEKQDKFQWPTDVKHREAIICPVDTPYTLPPPGAKATLSAPQMYRTEYQNVGSKKPITV